MDDWKSRPAEPFPPGNRLNPGGRPKRSPEIRAALKLGGIKAVNKAIELIDHVDPKVSLDACKWVGDQAIGKAAQEITGPDGESLIPRFDLERLSNDELRDFIRLGSAALAPGSGGDGDRSGESDPVPPGDSGAGGGVP